MRDSHGIGELAEAEGDCEKTEESDTQGFSYDEPQQGSDRIGFQELPIPVAMQRDARIHESEDG